ncbi:MAG: hypothetical protein ACRDV4_00385, partial [Acidimicrobiales bacterium]
TPEGVNGLYLTGDTFENEGNFMDLEVDFPCSGPDYCLSNGLPTGPAQWNVYVTGDTFTDGRGGNWVESEQAACIPQHNLVFENDTLDSTVDSNMVLLGSRSMECSEDSDLTVSNITATYPASGAPRTPDINVQDYSGVTISGNNLTFFAGLPTYYPDTPGWPGVSLCSVNGAVVENNVFNNAYAATETDTDCPFWSGSPPSSHLTACGNTYWLTEPITTPDGPAPPAAPRTDGRCP